MPTSKEFVLNYLNHAQDDGIFEGIQRYITLHDPKTMTKEEYKNRLDNSLKAIEEGNIISQNELKNEIQAWKRQRQYGRILRKMIY